MTKFIASLLILAALGFVGWQNKVDLLVWALPIINDLRDPIPPNRPVSWPKGPATASTPPNERPPNIILIVADDLGFNDVSWYNGGAADGSVMTPNIDAIAEHGVTFENGYAANAVCAPSRATMMTGRYSTRFGFEFTPIFKVGPTIFQWMEDEQESPLPFYIDLDEASSLPDMPDLGMPTEEVTIAEVLKDAGYYTAHIGKWHLGVSNGMRPENQGFDDSLYLAGTLYLPKDDPQVVNATIPGARVDRMVWATARYAAQFNGGEKFQPDGYLTDYYSNEAVKVIEANKHRPFFLYLAHWGVHNPLQAKKEDYDALAHIADPTLRTYGAMIRALDRGIGQVTKALEDNGLADNTLILFTSDNGGADYIGLPNINKPFRGWKLTHFEGGTHVPYMARWPAEIEGKRSFTPPIHHIDLFHTIAAAAKARLPVDRQLDGINLLPYINGTKTGAPHDTLFWREGHQQTVLHKGWKMIRADLPDKRWLFNLTDDPTEQVNLASSHPQQVELMENLLDAHNAQQAPPAWPSVLNGPILIDKPGTEPYVEGDEYIYWPN